MSRRKSRPYIAPEGYAPLVCTGKGAHRSYYFGSYFKTGRDGVEWWLSQTPRLRVRADGHRIDARRMNFPRDNHDPFTGQSRGYRIEERCGTCGRHFQRLDAKFYGEVEHLLANGVRVLDISWLER